MGQERQKSVYISFRCDTDTNETLKKIATAQHKPKSEVIRDLVEQAMKTGGYKLDDDRLYAMVQTAVQAVMKPHVERLAAISAKATQIGSASFFMSLYLAKLFVPEDDRTLVDEAAGEARQLGIEYLKLKDRDLDTFLREGAKKMGEDG